MKCRRSRTASSRSRPRNIEVTLSSTQRVEIGLDIGGQSEKVEVTAGSSILSSTSTQEHGISPKRYSSFPLLPERSRTAANFVLSMPGVSTGGQSNAFDARINGGLQTGDEATLDGVSMQQGFMSQGGMISIQQDFPMSPDMVSEVKVLTSNYAPNMARRRGQIMAVTKSGGSSFHGAAFDYYRNDALNATQWGASTRHHLASTTAAQTLVGQSRPGLWSESEDYLYFDYEAFRRQAGPMPDLVDTFSQGAHRRLHRLAGCERQSDTDL